ncbi:MAG: hypothetical protein J0L56_11040, partial [Chitinophagales bacterium]|nr:hypothetical protein [Chitinophagales bacterium]
ASKRSTPPCFSTIDNEIDRNIENMYYQELKNILDTKEVNKKYQKVNELNVSLDFLISKIRDYLKTIIPRKLNVEFNTIFSEFIKSEDILFDLAMNEFVKPRKTMFLNFNYTRTLDFYLFNNSDCTVDKSDILVNNIHGRIDDGGSEIIFGFGDELDRDYSRIESETIRGFFRFIKSFWYFKTSNYHNLIRFIESRNFQVIILGHSCGLSDRTMLNTIFEHQNCKSIKIYYHQTNKGNNFTELTEEISRHFRDKSEMRKKIVPFDKSSPMPQVSD